MAKQKAKVIRRRALRLEQSKDHPLFLFSLAAEELFQIADVSRVSRDEAGRLLGYQRPEVRRHVQDIVEYLDSGDVLFPNSLILALSSDVRFVQSRGPRIDDGLASAGTLEIPIPADSGRKPAWIVDGQQRAMALSKSRRPGLAVPINAFVADDVDLQRDQFLRVNNTKPLPRGLISELLPETNAVLPARMASRRIPAALCDMLNRDPESPFAGLIRRASLAPAERKQAVVSDLSIIKMLEDSISHPSGCLFPYRNLATGETDFEAIRLLLFTFWGAVKACFPDAWGKPPSRSRLMHGAGIRAMGRLMDRIMSSLDPRDPRTRGRIEDQLKAIRPVCHWTSGKWADLDDLGWDEVQNVPRHIRMLSNSLLRAHVQQWSATA